MQVGLIIPQGWKSSTCHRSPGLSAVAAIHIAMNWKWIVNATNRFVFCPLGANSQARSEHRSPSPHWFSWLPCSSGSCGEAIGGSTWAQGVDALTAGEQFTTFTEPLRLIAGALLVAVPAVLLIRAAWGWLHAPAQPSRGPIRR